MRLNVNIRNWKQRFCCNVWFIFSSRYLKVLSVEATARRCVTCKITLRINGCFYAFTFCLYEQNRAKRMKLLIIKNRLRKTPGFIRWASPGWCYASFHLNKSSSLLQIVVASLLVRVSSRTRRWTVSFHCVCVCLELFVCLYSVIKPVSNCR